MNEPSHLYRDRQGELHPVRTVQELPGCLFRCIRTTDGTTLYLHGSLLLPLT
jgi:hypothetical protein